MDILDSLQLEVDRIAPTLDSLKKSPSATIEYHPLYGALVWSDERPLKSLEDELAIRYLFYYRTSVLIGQPVPQIAPLWEYARKSFPNWPGFSTERCEPSPALAKEVEDSRAEFEALLEDTKSWPEIS